MNIFELIIKRNLHQRIFNDLIRIGDFERAEHHKNRILEINNILEEHEKAQQIQQH